MICHNSCLWYPIIRQASKIDLEDANITKRQVIRGWKSQKEGLAFQSQKHRSNISRYFLGKFAKVTILFWVEVVRVVRSWRRRSRIRTMVIAKPAVWGQIVSLAIYRSLYTEHGYDTSALLAFSRNYSQKRRGKNCSWQSKLCRILKYNWTSFETWTETQNSRYAMTI